MLATRTCFFALFGLALSGCAYMNPHVPVQVQNDTAEAQAVQARGAAQAVAQPAFTSNSGLYIGAEPAALNPAAVLPAVFKQQVGHAADGVTLSQAALFIFKASKVPVVMSYELQQAENLGRTMTGANNTMTGQFILYPENVSYDGSLSGYADYIAALYGVFWRYRDNSVEFFLTDTRTYFLRASPMISKQANNVSNQSDTGNSGAGGQVAASTSSSGSQITDYSMTANVWSQAQDNIKSMLDKNGQVVVNPDAGTITVTDTPPILNRVASYVSEVNSRISQQVAIAIKVYTFTVSHSLSQQFSLALAFKNLSKEYGLNVTPISPLQSLTGAESLSGMVLNGSTDSLDSKFNGTNLLFQVLRQYGALTAITTSSGIGLDNQPMPFQDLLRTSYLAQVTVTPSISAGTGPTASLVPGQVVTGFAAVFVPHVLDDNRILLNYNIKLSDLLALNQASSNGSSITTPNTTDRNFAQTVALTSGSTLVLAGVLRDSHNADDNAGAISRGWDNASTHTMVLIAITVSHLGSA